MSTDDCICLQTYTEDLVMLASQPQAEGGSVRIEGLTSPVVEGTIAAQPSAKRPVQKMCDQTSSREACEPGNIAWDASFMYVCVAPSQWKQTVLKD